MAKPLSRLTELESAGDDPSRIARVALAFALVALAQSAPRRRKPLLDKILDMDWIIP